MKLDNALAQYVYAVEQRESDIRLQFSQPRQTCITGRRQSRDVRLCRSIAARPCMNAGAICPAPAVLLQERRMQNCAFAYGLEVQDALDRNGPIVVLESTAIAQGLPWPDNLETAQAMEGAIRARGATAATIAVFDGIGADRAIGGRARRAGSVGRPSVR